MYSSSSLAFPRCSAGVETTTSIGTDLRWNVPLPAPETVLKDAEATSPLVCTIYRLKRLFRVYASRGGAKYRMFYMSIIVAGCVYEELSDGT